MCVVSSIAWGCDRDDRLRAEARLFLALYEATDHRAPIAERERKIVQLEQLALSEELVREARDQCVSAHRTLIRAERENANAGRKLDQAIAAQPQGEALQATATDGIRAEIDRAEQSLTDARGRFEKCEARTRTLSLRFKQGRLER
jgi:hypothetical protein